jgi:hypothetical protein
MDRRLFAPERLTETAQQLVHAAGTNTDTPSGWQLHDGGSPKLVTHSHSAELPFALAATPRSSAGGSPKPPRKNAQPKPNSKRTRSQPDGTCGSLVRELGSRVAILEEADPADRAALYEALNIAASYDPTDQTAELQLKLAWAQPRVGGASRTISTRPLLHAALRL